MPFGVIASLCNQRFGGASMEVGKAHSSDGNGISAPSVAL
jgi:hypothetical protein